MQQQDLKKMIGCEECDALYQRVHLDKKQRAYCQCCGAELYRNVPELNHYLAIVFTALIIFGIANSFSIVKVELQGISSETTLLGAAWVMYQADRAVVGFLILMTTFVVPLVYLLAMSFVLISTLFNSSSVKQLGPIQVKALRLLFLIRAWGMVEVFLIGILVTLVKLVTIVTVIPGTALWAFALLAVLMVYIASIKVKDLWDALEEYLAYA